MVLSRGSVEIVGVGRMQRLKYASLLHAMRGSAGSPPYRRASLSEGCFKGDRQQRLTVAAWRALTTDLTQPPEARWPSPAGPPRRDEPTYTAWVNREAHANTT
jgi:hypothetical protein